MNVGEIWTWNQNDSVITAEIVFCDPKIGVSYIRHASTHSGKSLCAVNHETFLKHYSPPKLWRPKAGEKFKFLTSPAYERLAVAIGMIDDHEVLIYTFEEGVGTYCCEIKAGSVLVPVE